MKIMKNYKKKLATVALVAFTAVLFTGCASWDRFVKDMNSQFNDGLEREITVRNMNGEVIEKYEGKFDVTYDSERIKFIDEQGKLHLIYYSELNTVTITEK